MSYEDPVNQRSMALDKRRNSFYERALRAVIKPSSVVIDAGAGIGTLGLMAAKLGAARVYLVEPATRIEAARKLAEANGVADRVVLIPDTLEAAPIDEQVDIILSVFTGNFLLEEDLLPTLFYARDRWLKPDGFLIPGGASMVTVPVSMSEYYDAQIGSWQQSFAGVSHAGMHDHAVNSLYYERFNDITHQQLATPKAFGALDFYEATQASCDETVSFVIEEDGVCHGLLGWFDMRFGDDTLSTGPGAPAMHWSQVYLPADPPITVQRGQKLTTTIRRAEQGEWHWRITSNDGDVQQHSTFLSQPLSVMELTRRSGTFRPTLNQRGEALKWLLASMDGEQSAEALSTLLQAKYPEVFRTVNAARRFVTGRIDRYCE